MSHVGAFMHAGQGKGAGAGLPVHGSVLVVDDEPGIRAALGAHFSRKGWQVLTAGNAFEAREHLESHSFDLVVSDIRMPNGDGTEVLRCARRLAPHASTILLTAFGSVPEAVAAIRMGAGDYLMKPVVWEQLESVAARLLTAREKHTGPPPASAGILVQSPRMLQALSRARAAAATAGTVLIEAERGTGKELLARFIHSAGARAQNPFVSLDCSALPEHLLESELFGRARAATPHGAQSAGRFALASGGTLLLEEVDRLPLHPQSRLLRLLCEREQFPFERVSTSLHVAPFDVRIIATTSVPLAESARQGRFRSDLFYRLNVIPLTLPPLRERREDIPLLAQAFAEQIAIRMVRSVPVLAPDFVSRMQQYAWPGNIRELHSFMLRVLSLHQADTLDGICFDLEAAQLYSSSAPALSSEKPVAAGAPIRELERRHLENTLAITRGNRTQAAGMLGISVRTIRNKIREYGLPPRRYA